MSIAPRRKITVPKSPRAGKVEDGCNDCQFYNECDKYVAGAECSLVKVDKVDSSSIEALDKLQDDIITNASRLLKRAEVLCIDGSVSFSDVDRLRKQLFDMVEKRRKTLSSSGDARSSAAKVLDL